MNKPRLEILAVSEYADFSKEGKLSVVGIFDEIYAKSVPANYGRCFVAFTVADARPNENIKLNFSISSPSGKKVMEKEAEGVIGKKGKGNFRLEVIGLPLKEFGDHKIVISYKEEELGYTIFRVIPPNNARQSS